MKVMNCKPGTTIESIILIDVKDVKIINENEIVLKRKYGDRKREARKYEIE